MKDWIENHTNWAYALRVLLINLIGIGLIALIIHITNSSSGIYIGGVFRWVILPLVIGLVYANIDAYKWRKRNVSVLTGKSNLDKHLDSQGEWGKAFKKQLYEQVYEGADTQDTAALYGIGARNYLSGDYDRAIIVYTKAINIDPTFTVAYGSRGVAYYKSGKYAESITDFTKAIELNPNYGKAHYDRGNAYIAIGEHDKAEADFNKAKELGYKGT
jgi:Flp pilus assembly protein TadD